MSYVNLILTDFVFRIPFFAIFFVTFYVGQIKIFQVDIISRLNDWFRYTWIILTYSVIMT